MDAVEDLILPDLRSDLQFLNGPIAVDGSPTWTIYDPPRGKYFRISWSSFHLLSNWAPITATELIAKIDRETTCRLSMNDVMGLIRFLFVNNLTVNSIDNGSQSYYQQYKAGQMPWTIQIFHSYLFFRIPLFRPQGFLRSTLPYVEWCFNSKILYILATFALLGLYLVSRQWDLFIGSFLHFFNWQGAVCYGLAIALSKTLHEFGHAYTAIRYDCRVPTMGIAFMGLLPMPYTDVSDAWRLTSQRQRIAVGAAGILVELALAIVATLAWSFIPDGSLRSAAFVLATTTWVMTLTVNSSPFMRFDGYYMLSDAWGVDNLQIRAFALARWRLRQILFAGNEPKPEQLPPTTEHKMVIYAYITWLYRLIMFFGLALMVYQFFFKALGLILFLVEIVFFIIRPIVKEFQAWKKLKTESMSVVRKLTLLTLLITIGVLVLFPWSSRVRVPAMLESARHHTLYAVESAQLKAIDVKLGDSVSAGQVLFKLESPKLKDEIALSEKRLDLYQLRMERAATNQNVSADIQVSIEQFATESARLSGLKKQRDRLIIKAPFSGVAVDLHKDLQLNAWINSALPLATIIDPQQSIIQGVAEENKVSALAEGQTGEFIPEDAFAPAIKIKVAEISKINIRELDQPYLASVFGGDIAVKQDASGKLVPTSSCFSVRFEPLQQSAITRKIRGTVVINAKPRSFIGRIADNALALLVRESGF